ncbi:diguanylate cyclase [Bermanella marisrubri]|uniref:diguanylate cyclase n=1 Tax=Bermanella marisrubri TaxID=207949 RepID=Q1MZ89_9GAMM|nr:GGDEF domain-containing protein [Bermanella marisrubri]EAT11244.1 Response regulator containing a CheY-like receiver domain and a GGDEF domain [Oceanobacter sp. RED65] [Bermanella marisrubri]QIZ82727.1 diguanylate cyclase [Bermanella marisrubri]
MSTDNRTDSDRWKHKYLNLIDDHEKLEKRFADQTAHLRRALIRLSVAAEGRDQDMDIQLEELRLLLRKEQLNGLNRIMDNLDKGYERWQSHQEKFQNQLAQTLIDIETQYDELPPSMSKALKSVRKKVRSEDKAQLLMALCEVLAIWANAVAEQLEGGSANGNGSGGGWFSRLFNKEGGDQQTSSANDEQGIVSSTEESYELNDTYEASVTGAENLTTEASKVLSALISKLALPSSEQPRALRLLNKVKSGLTWYELVPALEILSDLVVSALGSEQEEFEAFLKNLNERLLALKAWLKQGEDLEQKFSDSSTEFDLKMRGHLDELKQILESGDTNAMKGAVTQQLDDVFATLDGFKLEQKSREIVFKEHIGELNNRLTTMEKELEEAKEQLNQSQLKAMTDSLTGLPNRGAYDVYAQQEYERYKRYGGELSLIVCDVDKFKSINDTYGHQAGDKVLQLISRQVKKGTRETDLLARYGGEEFVVLLPETKQEDAVSVAEKIIEAVATSPFHFRGKRVQITISCGVASFKKGYRPEQVFDAADAALYRAKENGRNQYQLGVLKGLPGDQAGQDDVVTEG